jgi:hypothetical protein
MSSATLESPSRRRRSHKAKPATPLTLQRKVSLALAILCAISLLVVGARFFLAGLGSFQAQAFISAWSKTSEEPHPRAWQIAHDAAQRAVKLSPVANGSYQDTLGQIYSWQHFRQPYGAKSAQASRRNALKAYRAAVAARPTWPDTWARLAHTKLYLQEFDEEFSHALANAFTLGPWRIQINRELAEIGFNAWPNLTATQRLATLESARRSVKDGPKEANNIRRIAQASGHLGLLCVSLSRTSAKQHPICH